MKLGVIGTGYVGLVTGACLAEQGHQVTCYDIDQEKIRKIEQGQLPFYEAGLEALVQKHMNHSLFFTSRPQDLAETEADFICVGTPSNPDGSIDLSQVEAAATQIGRYAQHGKVVVDKSTVPVGTAVRVKKWVKAAMADQGIEHYVEVVSNPEFLREGSAVEDALRPDRVVFGVKEAKARKMMEDIYAMSPGKILVTNPKSAELIKYAANAFLALSISFVNRHVQAFPGYNILEETERLKKEINPRGFFKVGIGYGGSCFPKDVKEFIHYLKRQGLDASLLESVEKVNHAQKILAVDKLERMLGSVEGKTIGILGAAFKPHTDDMRESPTWTIIDELKRRKVKAIAVADPLAKFPTAPGVRVYSKEDLEGQQFRFVVPTWDGIILVTEWEEFKGSDYDPQYLWYYHKDKKIAFVDGRNIFYRYSPCSLYDGMGKGEKTLEGYNLVDKFLDVAASYVRLLEKVCEKAGANFEDVLLGMMLDQRIGRQSFKKFFEGNHRTYTSLYDAVP